MEKQVDIYSKPNKTSTLIKSEFSLYNKGFVIVEIGERAPTGNECQPYNIWYKVKNNLIEGWVLGLVSVFKIIFLSNNHYSFGQLKNAKVYENK